MPKSVNTQGTDGGSVTVGLPKPLYEIVGKGGAVSVGKFSSASLAAEQARKWWPDQQQDEDRTGKGWDVQVVGTK